MASKRQQRTRAKRYEEQGGKCYHCGCEMLPPGSSNGHMKHTPPNLCTLDHLDHKFDRRPDKIGRWVAACAACNQNRGLDRLKKEPIERRWRDSGRMPLALRRAER